MIERLLDDRLDMVVANRVDQDQAAYRPGHRTGNRLLTAFVASVFDSTFNDMLSGYRVFSRRFVKSFPVLSGGFEIETELTIHALELGLAAAEIDTPYYARPEGSASKLNTWSDGFRILRTIVHLYRAERPLPFFSGIGAALAIAAVGFAIPIVRDLHGNRAGAAAADGGAVDGADDSRLSVGRHRAGARHRDARPPRDEAAWPISRTARREKNGGELGA